jgi:hypothetical protein
VNDWRSRAERGEWQQILWEVLSDMPDENERLQRELLAKLRTSVPMRTRVSGMESILRHDTPNEAADIIRRQRLAEGGDGEAIKQEINHSDDVAAAAMLAALSLLYEAELDWTAQVEQFAAKITADDQETKRQKSKLGSTEIENQAPEFTRMAHADQAQGLVAEFRKLLKLAKFEAADEHEAQWIQQTIREIAEVAYQAGRHIQAGWGKPIELMAIKAENSARGRDKSNAARVANGNKHFAEAMAEMKRLVPRHGVSGASKIVESRFRIPGTDKPKLGFGASNLSKKYRRDMKI